MEKDKSVFRQLEKGFSLIELMIVLFIVILVSALTFSKFYGSATDIGGAEKILEETSARIVERRSDAVRLNGEDRRLALQQLTVSPLPMDFTNLNTTASLKIEGTDSDGNCVDDLTNKNLTCFSVSGGTAAWQLSYHQDEIKLPRGWQVITSRDSLGSLPLIGNGTNGRGVIVTKIGFDGKGKALALELGSSVWKTMPTGANVSETPSANNAPFWAIYFAVLENTPGGNSQVKAMIAIAIHPSGMIERFRYDNGWIGVNNRTLY